MKAQLLVCSAAFALPTAMAGLLPSENAPGSTGAGTPAMKRLALGEVKPAGWLRDWCETARDGYTSNMESVSDEYKRALDPEFRPSKTYHWVSHDPETHKRDDPSASFYCAEAAAYWFSGLIRLAYQLDDSGLKDFVHRRVDPYVSRITTNTVGFAFWLNRNKAEEFDRGSVWQFSAVSQFARGLVDYYSATGDERVLDAAERMVDDPNAYKVVARGENYSGLAHAAWDILQFRPASSAKPAFDEFCSEVIAGRSPCQNMRYVKPLIEHSGDFSFDVPCPDERKYIWQHGVISQEEMMTLLCVYLRTGNRRILDNLLAWREYLDRNCRQPHGAPVTDEYFGLTSGLRGTETCDVMCDLAFRCELLSALGDGRWGDDAERNFFNAVPATISRDFRTHAYFQVPNMVRRETSLTFSTGDSGDCAMARARPTLCCASNSNRLLPEYIRYAWLRPQEGGLAAALWCPCDVATTVGETIVRIRVRTDYPFDETIAVTVDPLKPVCFPIRLRIPSWCRNPIVSVNGERSKLAVEKGFVSFGRIWKSGDRIDLRFPMALRMEGGVDHHGARSAGRWCSVYHGPILYALGVPEKNENEPADPAFRTDYSLDPNFALASAKVIRKPMPAKWDWPFDAPVRIEEVGAVDGTRITLIPYGCTRLRMTMFPVQAVSAGK